MAALILLLLPSLSQAQAVAVAPLTLPRAQFLSATGAPLAGGCINFFATGTSTPQAIFADSGGVNQLANPLTLDAAGEASVWLSNTGYDIVANTGVVSTACSVSLGTQLWKETNKNPFSIINNGSNFIVASGTSDPGGAAGMLAYRSDIPCFRGFTTLWDCFTQNAATQTLTNKTLTSPIITTPTITGGATTGSPSLNGTLQPNGPATYISVANSVIGTVNNRLTKFVISGGVSQAQFLSTTDTGSSIGITVAGGGGTGTTATIQQSGTANCFFDNATTAGDYVQTSALTAGSCHDVGPTYPQIGQAIGRVLSTNVFNAALTFPVDLFSPEILGGQIGSSTGCTSIGPVTITNNNAQQNLLSCTIPANTLIAGSLLAVDVTGINSTASAQTITIGYSVGGGTPCTTQSGATGVANNQPWNGAAKFAVLTAGAGGTANWSCEYWSTASGGAVVGPFGIIGAPTISVNTTIPNTLLITVQMSVANAGNIVTAQLLKSVIY